MNLLDNYSHKKIKFIDQIDNKKSEINYRKLTLWQIIFKSSFQENKEMYPKIVYKYILQKAKNKFNVLM